MIDTRTYKTTYDNLRQIIIMKLAGSLLPEAKDMHSSLAVDSPFGVLYTEGERHPPSAQGGIMVSGCSSQCQMIPVLSYLHAERYHEQRTSSCATNVHRSGNGMMH
jgi:hypothetical protein